MSLSCLGLLPPGRWGRKESSYIRKSAQADVGPVPAWHRDGEQAMRGPLGSARAQAEGGEGAEVGCWGAAAELAEEEM